jgi:hypothetical protein
MGGNVALPIADCQLPIGIRFVAFRAFARRKGLSLPI